MTTFEWFLLIVIVIVVPLIIAAVVTLWTIDQANKRKRANRNDAQIGVKRKAALDPEEVAARKAARSQDAAVPATYETHPDREETFESDSGADLPEPTATPSAVGASDSGSDSGGSDGGSDGGGSSE